MRQEGKPTTKLDVLIESRTCGKGVGVDFDTANLIQGINEELEKVDESQRTKEFKDDLFTNAFGEDSQGRVRCMGRGIAHGKVHPGFPSNVQFALMSEQNEEFLQLKAGLEREKVKNEELKLELDSQKMELGKVKEGVINDVRAEFRDEINHMKLSLDFFVSLVDPATLQATLSRVTSHGAQKIANEVLPPEICQESHSVPNSGITNLQVGGQNEKASNFIDGSELIVNEESAPYMHQESHLVLPKTPIYGLVGSDVVLLCSEIPKEVVAEGVILSMDPKEEIDKVALGPEFVKVVIKKATQPNYYLERPRKAVSTVRDAVGKSVAWELVNVSKLVMAFLR
ncbi:hypothetical protein CDL12_17664 [Handroanthus impetiginosus]|uniref:Transposase Tnp1/En/Spm-like domain-containing protein n=1 Tax=Handroanthus impetiginosus TaxID=429701 RepID=A0A2G9GWU9_9LAMI|nr:hypothetical protein CDL12_17664 [Handroanthus impetiginosus]